mgnify:CR=1 FL=1
MALRLNPGIKRERGRAPKAHVPAPANVEIRDAGIPRSTVFLQTPACSDVEEIFIGIITVVVVSAETGVTNLHGGRFGAIPTEDQIDFGTETTFW